MGCFIAGAAAVPPMSVPRFGAAAVHNPETGTVYVIGGSISSPLPRTAPAIHSTGEVLRNTRAHPSTWGWSPMGETLHVPREGAAAVLYNGTIYIVGGRRCRPNSLCIVSSGESLRLGTRKSSNTGWKMLNQNMSMQRYRPAAAVMGDAMYVVGGRGTIFFQVQSGERYDFFTLQWSALPQTLAPGRAALTLMPYNGALWLLSVNASDVLHGLRAETAVSATASRAINTIDLPPWVQSFGRPGIVLRQTSLWILGGTLCYSKVYLAHPHECLPPAGNVIVNMDSRRIVRAGSPGILPEDRRTIIGAATVDLGDTGILSLGGQIRTTSDTFESISSVSLFFQRKWGPAPLKSTTERTTTTAAPRPKRSLSAGPILISAVVAVGMISVGIVGGMKYWRQAPAEDDDEELIELVTLASSSSSSGCSSVASWTSGRFATQQSFADRYLRPRDVQSYLTYILANIEPRYQPIINNTQHVHSAPPMTRQDALALLNEELSQIQ